MKAVKMRHTLPVTDRCSFVFLKGFGFQDEKTGEFASLDGRLPYVLTTKKLVTAIIAEGWPEDLPRVRLTPYN